MAQRSQMNAKEKLGREIDLTNASKDELIEHLCKIIEYEVEKGEDADYDLVRECSDWLDELTEDEVTFTPEELERKLAQLKAGSESKKPVKICKKAKLKTFVRVALIAAVLASFLSLSIVANKRGYDSTFDYISKQFNTVFGLNFGEQMNQDGITVIKSSHVVKYDDISAFLDGEGFDILYPRDLPNDVRIEQIIYLEENEVGKYTLAFSFSDDSYSLFVSNNYSINMDLLINSEEKIVNDIKYYITKKSSILYHAICHHNDYEYTIQCNDYDALLQIINNMEG